MDGRVKPGHDSGGVTPSSTGRLVDRPLRGEGPLAALMSRRFETAKKRYGLEFDFGGLDLDQFRRPPKAGDQIDLFGT